MWERASICFRVPLLEGCAAGWNLLHDRIDWRLGSGDSVSMWCDQWIPRLQRLDQFAWSNVWINSQFQVVADLCLNGDWNLEIWRTIFPVDVYKWIIALPPPTLRVLLILWRV